jgi:ditrans,polycis-polyprenyl diphosphate synthase
MLTSSWFKKEKRSLLERLVIKILKTREIPTHVAFIMDGNRRFAKQKQLDSVVTGHLHGFDKLTHVSNASASLSKTMLTVSFTDTWMV